MMQEPRRSVRRRRLTRRTFGIAAVAGVVVAVVGATRVLAAEEELTPFDFGAIGDGRADDTDSLQHWLNSARPDKALVIGGRFVARKPLELRDASDVRIESRSGEILFRPLEPVDHEAALTIAGCKRVQVTGLKISFGLTSHCDGIRIRQSRNILLDKCVVLRATWAGISVFDDKPGTSGAVRVTRNRVYACRYGIVVNSRDTTIEANYVQGAWFAQDRGPWTPAATLWDGVVLSKGASGVLVSRNKVTDTGQSGIYTEAVQNIRVIGNLVSKAQNIGIDIGPVTGRASDLIVEDNTVFDGANGGIHLYNVSAASVQNNTIAFSHVDYFGAQLTASGIILNALCVDIDIRANSISQPRGIGISISGPSRASAKMSDNLIVAKRSVDLRTS